MKMKCRFDKKLISFYLDNELDEEKAYKVELHLSKCKKCRDILSGFKKVDSMLENLEDVKVSSDYEIGFQKKLEKAISKKKIDITEQDKKDLWQEVKNIFSEAPNFVKVVVPAVFIIVISAVIFSLIPGQYPAVITAKGIVEQYNFQENDWQTLKPGQTINKGDLIRTAQNSIIDIELEGIYKMRIKPESQVKVNDIFTTKRSGIAKFKLEKGNLVAKIDKQLKKSKFQVETPYGIAEAKGTAFLVDISKLNQFMLGVVEGKVLVRTPKEEFLVKEDEKAIVDSLGFSKGPVPLAEAKDEILEEVRRIGQIFVVLDISNSSNRTEELLKPARFYAFGKYPEEVGSLLDNAISLVLKASETGNREYHLSSVKELEQILQKYPSDRYNPNIMLFVGAYYDHLGLYNKAIEMFQSVIDKYPETEWASIAVLAQAIIYDKRLEDSIKANQKYQKILNLYSDSLEAKYIEQDTGLIKETPAR